ncbi:MAG TPA: DUF1573 domain-containing protein [Flavisolibacter sp.]|nr:DUF1573 domain-containing protein [Flavisolibacter sp.]
MKSFFLFAFCSSLVACNVSGEKKTAETNTTAYVIGENKQIEDSASLTTIEWLDSVEQNLGPINKGAVVEISWKFKNTGDRPLVIQDVRPACGCTVADKPTEPIAPGAEGVIKAKYDSEGGSGTIHKEMTVLANNRNRNNGLDNKLSFSADVKE